MEGKKSLKEKLKIQDFICRGSATIVIDLVESYYMTTYSLQNKLKSGIADKMKSQGIDIEALKEILNQDENLISEIFNSNSEVFKDIDDVPMPQDYLDAKARIEAIKQSLMDNQTLSVENRTELKKEIKDGEEALEIIKTNHIQKSLQANPEKLAQNPKALKAMVNLISTKTNVEKIENDPDRVLFKIQKEIEKEFIFGKEEEAKILNLELPSKILFSKSDFVELLEEISKEQENMMSSDCMDFFLNMRSLKD
jgi:hypothetical protein